MKLSLLSLLTTILLLATTHLLAQSAQPTSRTVSESDSLALVDLYNSTNGANWSHKDNWLTGPVNTWYGVTVEEGRVTRLALTQNLLKGNLPASISNLTALTFIYLSYNQLNGNIPATIGNLTVLQHLFLDNNKLSGYIPTSISNLTALTHLRLAGNRLSGIIPESIGNLTALTSLDLSFNKLIGSIPASIGHLTVLTSLDLSYNRLSGSILENIGNLTALTSLDLGYNQLSGSIPETIGNLTALTSLDLGYNQLSGSIPETIGNLTALTFLYLSENQLSGLIPESIGKLTALNNLYLGGNQLSGSIPESIGKLTALDNLYLTSNQLSGSIPESIGNLTALNDLYLAGNQLSGRIPESIGNLTTLGNLNLSYNRLSGRIPENIGNLITLIELSLSVNQLSGNIPASIGKLTALHSLLLNNNQLSGPVPASLINIPQYIRVDHNQLTSLPAFTGSGLRLETSYNQLTFESLEANVKILTNSYFYAPQDSVGRADTVVLADGESIQLSARVGGANNRYQWTRNGIPITGATRDSLTVIKAGSYSCQITNTVVKYITLHRRQVHVRGNSNGTGSILREYWANVEGNQTSQVPVNTTPTSINYLASFEATSNVGDRYASRVRGYLWAPQTGYYTFWIAADDYGDLYLSTDDKATTKQLIAYIKGYATPRQWNKHYSQKSAPIYLEQGKRYYIEALQKENWVNDNLAVAWRLPSASPTSAPVVIPGAVLSPFMPDNVRQEAATEATLTAPLAAYPNPFTDQVTIQFTAQQNGRAVLELYNTQGIRVGSLFEGALKAGESQTVEVQVSRWPKGLYLLQLRNGNHTQQLKLARRQ